MATILIVNDQEAKREMLSTLLSRAGYQVIDAPDGEKGLATARENLPRVIITDFLMPGMDGYAFIQAIRRDKRIANIPVILYSAIFDERELESIAHGSWLLRVLPQPSKPEVILETIASVLVPKPGPDASDLAHEREHSRLLAKKLMEKAAELAAVNRRLSISETQYRALFESDPLPRLVTDANTTGILAVNNAAIQHYGYSREEFLGMSAADLCPADAAADVRATFERIASQPSVVVERQQRIKSGSLIDVVIQANAIQFSGRLAWSSVVEDVTERKRVERELRDSKDLLRDLAAGIQSAREDERTFLARELHDQLGQELTAIRMAFEWLRAHFEGDPADVTRRIGSSIEIVDRTLRTVQTLATQLRPGILDYGIHAAVEWQAREFQERTGILCKLEVLEEVPLAPNRAATVFRIVQETLTNIARHSGADLVNISLFTDGSDLVLEIRDNGRGIQPEEIARRSSLGLVGMKERATLAGGTITFQGVPGAGTTVSARIPISG